MPPPQGRITMRPCGTDFNNKQGQADSYTDTNSPVLVFCIRLVLPGGASPSPTAGTGGPCSARGVFRSYFSAKKSRLWKAAVMKRQAALPVVSHSMWALFFVFSSMPFTRCSATTSG